MSPEDEISAARSVGSSVALVKAHFIGSSNAALPASTVAPAEESEAYSQLFEQHNALEPPYPPDILCMLLEHSCALRQNIDSYATNIDGHGHRFEPALDLDANDSGARIGDAIYDAAVRAKQLRIDAGEEVPPPVDTELEDSVAYPEAAEIEARRKQLITAMRREKSRLDAFFKACCLDDSFVSLRKKTRMDVEVLGNGFWEVIRDGRGVPAQFNYIPGFTVRLLALDAKPVEVDVRVKVSAFEYDTVRVQKRFRRFVQVFDSKAVYYREFGDPRAVSSQTGKAYKTVAALLAAEPDSSPANEILHFKVHSPRSAYGIPRWIGCLLAVLGTRQAEEVNFLYFENKSVPPLALLVSGGRISQETVDRVSSYIETEIKGKRNFHKILVLEAEPAAQSSPLETNNRMRIELRPLTSAQQSDALFQKYDERNVDKVGQSFRLPRLLRGDPRDQNRATALAALAFTEMQVFAPEREDFDYVINAKILPELDARFWRFVSKTAVASNPSEQAEIIERMVNANLLTGDEGRQLIEAVFNREFRYLNQEWSQVPPKLYEKGARMEAPPDGEAQAADDFDATFDDQNVEKAGKPSPTLGDVPSRFEKNDAGEDVEVLQIPRQTWDAWFPSPPSKSK